MKTLQGTTAYSGIAKGIACMYTEQAEENIPHYLILKKNIDDEILRLKSAFSKAKKQLKGLLVGSSALHSESAVEVVRAHGLILDDKAVSDKVENLIKKRRINAEHAVSDAFGEYIEQFKRKDLHFAELAHDVMDVRNRVLSCFSAIGGHFECSVGERQPVIVTSTFLTPSMVLNIPKEHVLAFVTKEGGFTTHATILAETYGVPIIFGVDVENNIKCGDKLIVDGSLGRVIISPDSKTKDYYEKKIKKILTRRAVCEVRKEEPARTNVGKRVKLRVNISTPEEMQLIKGFNYDGVGLLRTEFLFLEKTEPPAECEQINMYNHVLEQAQGKPVTVRLLDIGGDKMPNYLNLPMQENPDLGIRGARALDFFHDIYVTQIRAILRSSVNGALKILYPMIADINDLYSFVKLVKTAKADLRKEKIKFGANVEEGIMIETPAAALMADILLKQTDFANIGSNDLLQYTLAASRGNAYVENRYHIAHPALIQLMEMVVKAGNKHKKEICLCGEISSFEEFYPVLLSIGLRSFSVSASKFADIKCHLLHEKKYNKSILESFYKLNTKKQLDQFFTRKY